MKLKLFILLISIVILGGCGGRRWDQVSYYDPNWTPENLIYAKKVVAHYAEDWQGLWLGGMKQYKDSESTYYVTMDTNGNNEQILPYPYYPYFSPQGTYVCYVDTTSTFHIIRRADTQEVYSFQPTTEAISELDWSPDERKLAFSTELLPTTVIGPILYVVDINGSNFKKVSEGESPTWSPDGKTIVFDHCYSVGLNVSGEGLSVYTVSNEAVLKISSLSTREGHNPDFMSDNQIVIFNYEYDSYCGTTKIGTINILTGTTLEIISGQVLYPKWSANGIIYNGITYGESLDSGIWISTINGSGLRQIK